MEIIITKCLWFLKKINLIQLCRTELKVGTGEFFVLIATMEIAAALFVLKKKSEKHSGFTSVCSDLYGLGVFPAWIFGTSVVLQGLGNGGDG